MRYKLFNDDCVTIMKSIGDGRIDMAITSPPYDSLRGYTGFAFDSKLILQELFRIIKDGGVVIWVVGDQTIDGSETGTSLKQALYAKEVGFKLYDTMIYHKENYIPLTHKRYEQAWEYMFCFSKGIPESFNPIRIPCKLSGRNRSGTFMQSPNDANFTPAHSQKCVSETKIGPNIFSYSVGHEKRNHPAVFPTQLAEDQIVTWSNVNDVVLDPMMGSGTVGLCAAKLNRKFVGIELSREYFVDAKQRIEQVFESVPLITISKK